ncbi:hypothetical protein BSL78_18794 [Apostichopus japonicus]|uniref:Fucosyltransferase n=1 Tax=Stichopus japonicus TaxID=307972 RepID=A0A2G8K8N4_STIJA|nr:hypothetical protein BSL78_18794 [Apostichopus japonicus]
MSQLWVLQTNESPLTCVSLRPPEGIRGVTFNLSFIYHTESDIPTPYGWFQKFDSPKDEDVNWFSIKTKLIMWTSSHCPLSSRQYKRRDFVLSLKRYLDISMFGACGDYELRGDEYLQTSSEYKFVLALENSCCSQYITEKFWDALTIHNQIPVVYGATREEYEKVAPPNSFIFIQDFSSLEMLSKTIQEIGSDEEKYKRYHSWRRLGYTMKQHKGKDRIYKCHSICRLSEHERRAKHGEKFHFNETGELYYGGCRNCQGEVDALTGMK